MKSNPPVSVSFPCTVAGEGVTVVMQRSHPLSESWADGIVNGPPRETGDTIAVDSPISATHDTRHDLLKALAVYTLWGWRFSVEDATP